jgi:pimeloyl-ACP methyl ester carboxylesterase
MRSGAIFLPGVITPAEVAYSALRAAFDDPDRIILRNLAVYDTDEPPADYDLNAEIAAVLDTAKGAGLDRLHLVGYSAGGAVAAAVAARNPERLVSLALLEPAWLGNAAMRGEERDAHEAIIAAMGLAPEEVLPTFVKLQLAPGVQPPSPPPGPPPAWMAKRPSGLKAIEAAFRGYELDMEALRRFPGPVLYILGGLSNPALYRRRAERARELFSDFTLEEFAERHHFSPPHRMEPKRVVEILKALWARAEATEVF